MQTIMEPIFEIAYLVFAVTIGIIMIANSGVDRKFSLFGIASLVLGVGDAFHLIPRMYGLITNTMAENTFALGIGTLVTSITMTIFYVLIFRFWHRENHIMENKLLKFLMYSLVFARIILCMFPQNEWFVADSPLSWGIYRNIPFVLIGCIIITMFCHQRAKAFKFAPLAITLSFLFYIPVVIWADKFPMIGMLMLPKTLCYVWFILMGYREFKKSKTVKR